MSEASTPSAPTAYAARLEVDYTDERNRVTTAFRLVLVIPIAIVYGVLTEGATTTSTTTVAGDTVKTVTTTSGGIVAGLFMATLLMVLFRQRYPRWWFDFARELTRFATRIGAYFVLLTDEYPSTVEEQKVHLDIDYTVVERDLNRWLPLVKWLLAFPQYLLVGALFGSGYVVATTVQDGRAVAYSTPSLIGASVLIAAIAMLFTTRYPTGLYDLVVGINRWSYRLVAYLALMTDQYPPFRLAA